MPFDLYNASTLIGAVENIIPIRTFLKDRYFPDADIFPTEEVLVDYKDGHAKMAPFVVPRKKGITIERDAYRTERYAPPMIAPQRMLTIDDLNRRGFGEDLWANRSPQERQAEVLGTDLAEMDEMITRREEWMAGQVLMNNGLIMKHFADKYGSNEFQEFELKFYDGTNNPNVYTPAVDWDQPGATIFQDLLAMVQQIARYGLPATDLIVAPNVFHAMLTNDEFYKVFENRRYEMGMIAPTELPNGVSSYGTVNALGRTLNLFTYDEQFFDDETGQFEAVIPDNTILLTSPNVGRTAYGAVSQVEQSDGIIHSYAARRVPKYMSDDRADTREIRLTARPIMIPNNIRGYMTAQVLA